ncbi:TPA: hypothetical protein ACJK1S_001241 [Acinetobacter baumannii]
MIKFITVWVLTVTQHQMSATESTYQLQYATQSICEKQKLRHETDRTDVRCDFQQVPVYVGSKP